MDDAGQCVRSSQVAHSLFMHFLYKQHTQHRRRRCCRCCNETHNSWCNRFNLHLLYLIPWIGVCECFFSLSLLSTSSLAFFTSVVTFQLVIFFISRVWFVWLFGFFGVCVCAFIYTLLLVLWLLRLHRRHDDTNVLR